jgi:hypothetical protein
MKTETTSGNFDVIVMIKKEFGFLTGRGFRIAKQSKGNGWAEVYYRNDSCGIVVTFEGRDQSVFVELCRLTDGTFPPKPNETRLRNDRVEIGYLLAVRAPDRIVRGYVTGLPPPSGGAEGTMAAQAANLRECASDFLDGDMTVLELAMPGLHQRAAEISEEKWGTAEASAEQMAIQASAVFLGDYRADAATTLAVHRVRGLAQEAGQRHPSDFGIQYLFHVGGPGHAPGYEGVRTGSFRRANGQKEIQIAVPEVLETTPEEFLARSLEEGLALAELYFMRKHKGASLDAARQATLEVVAQLRPEIHPEDDR